MTKLEKFKEVNAQLTTVLSQMETRIFIENCKDYSKKEKIKEEKAELAVEIKQ